MLQEGVEDMLAYGKAGPALGYHGTGTVVPWRSNAALGLLALGERDHARRLAIEELDVYRDSGVARGFGVALRALALIDGGDREIELLQEAVAVLESSYARLEHARALVDLGAALRRRRRRTDARKPLHEALDLAHRCGATALVTRARDELAATGARPRRLVLSGIDALTASERRIARMAAEGLSNKEIAQALFVTVKTVETHLGHAYQKLDIASRSDLPQALAHAQAEA
jgi:DNA-binding CsgD family transcriptional regulator